MTTTDTMKSTGLQCIADRSTLYNALNKLSSSIPKRSTLPVLENVCIIVDSEGMEMSTTDLERRTSVAIQNHTHVLEVASIGMLTVPYKELVTLLKSLKDEEVYFSQDGYTLHIDTDSTSVVLSGIPTDEYPVAPTPQAKNLIPTQDITLPIETLRKMVTLTAFAAADDDSRPVLTGISVQLKNNVLRFAAADAFRLAVCSETIADSGSWDFDLLIPAKSLVDVCKHLPKATKKYPNPGDITIVCQDKNFATFTSVHFTMYTRLIDGTYPNFERIIPQECDCIAVCDIQALKSAVETVKPIAKEASNITRFIVNGHIDVSADAENPNWKQGDPEENKMLHSQATVPAETTNTEGEEIKIKFNNTYVLDFLTAHPQGNVQIELAKPTKHVITWNATQPKEETSTKPAKVLYPDTPGFVGIIMPMNPKR